MTASSTAAAAQIASDASAERIAEFLGKEFAKQADASIEIANLLGKEIAAASLDTKTAIESSTQRLAELLRQDFRQATDASLDTKLAIEASNQRLAEIHRQESRQATE